MTSINKEPIIEIFIDECFSLIAEQQEYMKQAEEKQEYDKECINDIFRITHTIKADATMVLFDQIAGLSRTLEKLLYYYRDEETAGVNFKVFHTLMQKATAFYQAEADKIAAGSEPDGDSSKLSEEIMAYLEKLHGEKKVLLPEVTDTIEQRYYIPSKVNKPEGELPAPQEKEGSLFLQKPERDTDIKKFLKPMGTQDIMANVRMRMKSYNIADVDMTKLCRLEMSLDRVVMEAEDRGGQFTEENFTELKLLTAAVKEWCISQRMASMLVVTSKAARVIDEMKERVEKQIKLETTGDKLLLERYKIEKVSSAIIHIIRNAVDHGIETPGQRLEAGKTETGVIRITYEEDSNKKGIRITVCDDGGGIDPDIILETAKEKQLLKKAKTDYKEEEIYSLLFEPGFSTTQTANDYSGRGVGLDAVAHNIRELNGTVSVESRKGAWTKLILQIPLDQLADIKLDKEEAINESLNSRR